MVPGGAEGPLGPGDGLRVGPGGTPFADVRRIAVLRGGGLGDLLFAVPAIESLAAAYPDARITLIGAPAHAALVPGRVEAVSEVLVLPRAPGLRPPGPGERSEPAAVDALAATARERGFDLAVQLHGGGRQSNPFLLSLGARHTVGAATPDAEPLERSLPYRYYQHEVLRALEIAGLAGARPAALTPRLAVLPGDREAARRAIGPELGRYVVIHAGATDERRRWPAASFGEVSARVVAELGLRVAVVGDATERALVGTVVAHARRRLGDARGDRVHDLGGRLGLDGLVGLLAGAAVVVGNDSGPRHLAEAVGAPTVGVFWAGNLINAGPLGRSEHRVHLSWTSRCPECGVDITQVGWSAERCPHDPSVVADVPVDAVYEEVADLTATIPPPRGR